LLVVFERRNVIIAIAMQVGLWHVLIIHTLRDLKPPLVTAVFLLRSRRCCDGMRVNYCGCQAVEFDDL
jgi:hypothetical protein